MNSTTLIRQAVVMLLVCLTKPAFAKDGDYAPVIPLETSPSWYGLAQGGKNCTTGNLNGDERLDLVVINFDYEIDIYFNTDAGLPVEPNARLTPGASPYSMQVISADLAGDGYADLIIRAYDVEDSSMYFLLLENTSGIPASDPVWISPKYLSYDMALGDLDGDQAEELILPVADGPAIAYRGTPEGRFEALPFWTSALAVPSTRAGLADLDNDGDLDLVLAGSQLHMVIHKNLDGSLETTPSWQGSYAIRPVSMDFADCDGDGFKDIVLGAYQGASAAFRNTSGVFEDTPMWLGWPGADIRDKSFFSLMTWSDFNGDGYPELLMSSMWNESDSYGGDHLYVFYNDLGEMASQPTWTSSTERCFEASFCSDVNSDSLADIVATNYDGCPEIYFNHLDGFSETGVTLSMPSHLFSVGDPCFLDAQLANLGPKQASVPVFVVLEVFGSYYCAPGFQPAEQGVDWFTLDIYPGPSVLHVLPEFAWPEVAGSASGLCFYGAMTDAAMMRIVGRMDVFYFGYQ